MTSRRASRIRMGKKRSQRQTTRLRGRRGTQQRLKLVSLLKNGRRDLRERANNCQIMRNLKGRNIRALVDGKRVTVVSGESKKSRVAPLRNVSRRGVTILINVEPVARKRGKDKNLGTGERSCHWGGGRSIRRRGRRFFDRIHNICFFIMS